MKERNKVLSSLKSSTFDWSFKIARLINLSLRYISQAPASENISTIMRFLEIYTNFDEEKALSQKIYSYLVTKDYYGHLRKLCDVRIPPIMTETIKAPTPMAETIFNLIVQPLSLISEESEFAKNVLLNLTINFLSEPFSEQLDFYVVPSLASQQNFPYVVWSKVLHQNEVQASPWLLYSFLKIGKLQLGQDQGFDVHTYLSVLSDLTGAIMDSKTISCMSNEENESDDEDESKLMDVECYDIDASNIQRRSVVMLNDEQVVASLVAATEKSPNEPLALTALCKLCHNLLLSDPLALHHFRLLYTLAFRPVLLHRLWNLILDTKRPSLMGSSIPLLTVIKKTSSKIKNT